ncbi:MAG: hypothetical protein PHO56_01225 [Patescibacteria group bacterium]|nr:hypothetical protein [Patescibacteria group bacterium]
MKKIILIVDDDNYWRSAIISLIKREPDLAGFKLLDVASASFAAEKIKEAGAANIALIITDGRLMGDETAFEVYDECVLAGYLGKFILFSCDPDAIGKLALAKNHSPADMFFDQICKSKGFELLRVILEALTE